MSIITISRGKYSGGKLIAEKIAKQLDYPCLGRDELLETVRTFGKKGWDYTSISDLSDFFKQAPGKRVTQMNILRASLLKFSREGNLVYHGSVGHLLLSSIPNTLRARIIVSMDQRISSAMKFLGVDYDAAFTTIKKDDQECEYLARSLYDVNSQDPSLYDVTLNLNNVSIGNAVQTLIEMSGRDNFIPTKESIREFKDLYIGSVVLEKLSNNSMTESAEIMVTAKQSQITIYGQAKSEEIIEAIRDVALDVNGVSDVACNIGVNSCFAVSDNKESRCLNSNFK